jgi:hypothetical protein
MEMFNEVLGHGQNGNDLLAIEMKYNGGEFTVKIVELENRIF